VTSFPRAIRCASFILPRAISNSRRATSSTVDGESDALLEPPIRSWRYVISAPRATFSAVRRAASSSSCF
jgi:hypothetical protein